MEIVKCETADGLILNGLYSRPEYEGKKIIINIHGMGGSVMLEDFHIAMHDNYPNNGVAYLAGENRGLGVVTPFMNNKGKLTTIGSAFEQFEDSVLDIQAWVDFALANNYTEIWLQGHSLGCTKIAYFLDKKPNQHIKGVIFLSPAPILGLSSIRGGKEAVSKAKELLAKGKGDELMRDNDWGAVLLSAKTIINLFGERSELGIFDFADDNKHVSVIEKIKIPVIAFTGTKDNGIVLINEPHKAMEILKKELSNSPKVKTLVFEGARHLFDGYGQRITDEVLNFM